MTVLAPSIAFTLPPHLEAHEPPERRGAGGRDGVRLLISRAHTGGIEHRGFRDLVHALLPGDLLVINDSATMPAAVTSLDGPVVHVSTPRPDGSWLVELRRPTGTGTVPEPDHPGSDELALPGGATLRLIARFTDRLWIARVDTAMLPYLYGYGRPIRYGYVSRPWPIGDYQTVFATRPGSAEMPSAARPFTPELVTRLVAGGVSVVPITLHAGVASPEAHEPPYPEPYAVPAATARAVNMTRRAGGRVVAIGTTVVRALETVASPQGIVRSASGWSETIVTPERGVWAVDGLLTGLHEPRSSHLSMLAAFAERDLLRRCYTAALDEGYLWHEFGDTHLLLP